MFIRAVRHLACDDEQSPSIKMQEGAWPNLRKKKGASKGNIFELLLEASESREESRRAQLLESFNVKEFFKEGSISVDDRTCQGLECEICIKICPTKALFWKDGKVGIVDELCVFCGACVLNCIVDDCIRVSRKRPDGKMEIFSKPSDVILLCNSINSQKRRSRVESVLPDAEAYLRRFGKIAPPGLNRLEKHGDKNAEIEKS